MRVYHFLNKKYGVENIIKRHLKIATIMELNDPFELLGLELSDKKLRRNIFNIRKYISKQFGLLCFSKSWTNPVQWSHYADRHKGIVLGFDVPDKYLFEVEYSSKRLSEEVEKIQSVEKINQNDIKRLLSVKYRHWQYEKEVRWLVRLNKKSSNGLYYKEFSSDLVLKQVIVGLRSCISRCEISDALPGNRNDVEVFKSRSAFKSFRVVRNRNESLWA